MKKLAYIFTIGLILSLTSCNSFLDRSPITSMGSEAFFSNEDALVVFLNGFLKDYTPSAQDLSSGDEYCDIIATYSSTSFLTTEVWSPSQQSGWSASDWNDIYSINYFIAHVRKVPDLSEEKYNHYEGTGRFWRAWRYWEKVKTFGAVPWYDEPIDADDEAGLYKPRDSREYVMDKVLEDLNFASENILATSEWLDWHVNKYVALALKIRICLFEGTYRKYHPVDPSTGKAWEDATAPTRFLTECANACEELMNSGTFKLVDDGTEEGRQTQFRNLFNSDETDYTENIFYREYSPSVNSSHSVTWFFVSSASAGRCSLDWEFVQTYLHHDGSRHYEKIAERQAAGEEVSLEEEMFDSETEDRDYRMQQEMMIPGYRKIVNGVDSLYSPNLNVASSGYFPIKWIKDDDQYDASNTSKYPIVAFRYAEALLAYAESKCELGQFSDDVWDKTIKLLRERAGVDGRRRTDIDQSLADYYGGLTDCDLVEIRRERAIEMLLENIRYDDLMRWHLGDLLNKTWYGIYIPEANVKYDLDGNGSYDVCAVNSSDADTEGVTATIDLTTGQFTLTNGDSGRLTIHVERHFDESRYLHPIPQTALNINPDLGQNYYWQ